MILVYTETTPFMKAFIMIQRQPSSPAKVSLSARIVRRSVSSSVSAASSSLSLPPLSSLLAYVKVIMITPPKLIIIAIPSNREIPSLIKQKQISVAQNGVVFDSVCSTVTDTSEFPTM